MTAVDDRGTILHSAENQFLSPLISRPDSRRGRVILSLPDARAVQLKTLEGNLLVMNGMVRHLDFSDAQLRAGAEQSSGQVKARIESVKRTGSTVEIGIVCLSPEPTMSAGETDEMRQAIRFYSHSRSIAIEMVDTKGNIHFPGGMGMRSSGASSARQASATGSNTPALRTDTISAHFSLADGAEPSTLRLTTVERQGPDQRVPFKLTDVPIRHLE